MVLKVLGLSSLEFPGLFLSAEQFFWFLQVKKTFFVFSLLCSATAAVGRLSTAWLSLFPPFGCVDTGFE